MGIGMQIIRARFLFLVLLLGSSMVWSENEKRLSTSAPNTPGAPDLDFGNEDELDNSIYSQMGQGNDYHSWMYWSLGFTVAAGGMTYFLWDKETPPKTVKP
jgi:hypothetical protein